MNILAFSGSLRRDSWNTRLLRAVTQRLPDSVTLTMASIGDLPHYDGDLDVEPKPAAVVRLLAAVAAADGLLFVTPEYNYSVPGVLKNAIDWASRPAYRSPLALRPAGLLTATTGPVGGARAQAHLKQILGGTLTPIYPAPELLVAAVDRRLDADGHVTDPELDSRLRRYVDGYLDWVQGQLAASRSI